MKGLVKQVTKSKSGKAWRVQIGEAWYGAKFDSKLDEAVGKNIDYAFKSDPKYGDWIESWMYDHVEEIAGKFQPKNGEDRWWLAFISNQVAHAIAAGKIQGPGDIYPWALAAYAAIRKLGNSDDVPF